MEIWFWYIWLRYSYRAELDYAAILWLHLDKYRVWLELVDCSATKYDEMSLRCDEIRREPLRSRENILNAAQTKVIGLKIAPL